MSEPIRHGWQDFRITLESKMEEHARAMEELENNTKPNQISLEIKEKVRSPALGPSQPMSEPTTFLDIIQQTPPSFSTLRAELKPSDFVKTSFSSESVKTNALPAKIPAPIVLVTKAEEDDDLEEEVAKVQKSLEKVTISYAKKAVLMKAEEEAEEADDEEEAEEEADAEAEVDEEADGEEEEVLTKSDEEAEEEADVEEEAEEAEEEENYEMTQIKKVRYWHETNSHKLYKYISEDEVGEVVGKWHNIGGIVTISPV